MKDVPDKLLNGWRNVGYIFITVGTDAFGMPVQKEL